MSQIKEEVFIRQLVLETLDVTLKFRQKCTGDVSCVVWDAAIVLSKYLDFSNKNHNWLTGKNVLELGSGLGCVGITAACFGANVVLTDLAETLPLTKENIELNKSLWKAGDGSCEAQVLNWEENTDTDFSPDIIILADCVYYEVSILPLIRTLEKFFKNSDNIYALLCQEERDTPIQIEVWKKFMTELESKFQIQDIPRSEHHPKFSSHDIKIFKISKLL